MPNQYTSGIPAVKMDMVKNMQVELNDLTTTLEESVQLVLILKLRELRLDRFL